ncbi:MULTISPECIES: hypothetical protein [Clostridium]|uniref:hypothetical protein n=1 Tax=Clostridium TaxID=1485 RepID=UPI000825551E|nr:MULTISPECIES: hypothetical protein [Clostridium]PJI06785.1 hypothetical protein CUB90_02385 [Clostridium sp. CT7]
MSTINNISNNLYTQPNNQVSNNTQEQFKAHHHHHHSEQSQDSIQLSNQGSQGESSSTDYVSNILNSLVSNGTLTQNQVSSIESAFTASNQINSSGTYSASTTNPISNLVNNGTISQDQANSIRSAFKSSVHAHHHGNGQYNQNSANTTPIQSVQDDLLQNLSGLNDPSQNSIDTLFQASDDSSSDILNN